MVIEHFLNWVQSASLAKRIDAAGALARAYLRDDLKEDEREDVEAAITTLLEDPAPGVRDALAEGLKDHENAPRHVILSLAADTNEIAIKVLSMSPVFLDQELEHMIRAYDVEKQIAIACRSQISQSVLHAICANGCEEACLGLLINPAARFKDHNIHIMAERFGTNREIRLILMDRENLATKTRVLLINKTGEVLNQFVTKKSWLSKVRADEVIADACDKACIGYAANAPDEDVAIVAKSLIDEGRVSVSFLLRAICMGNITLAAAVFSELSGVKMERIETIFSTNKKAAFKAVYDRADLPQSAFSIFQCAISTWRKLLSSKEQISEARLPFLVTREVLQSYMNESDEIVDELLVILRRLSAETARECAKYKASQLAQEAGVIVSEVPAETMVETSEDASVVNMASIEDEFLEAFKQPKLIENEPKEHKPAIVAEAAEVHDQNTNISDMNERDADEDWQWSDIFSKIDQLAANNKAIQDRLNSHAQKVDPKPSPLAMDLGEYVGDIELDAIENVFTDAIFNMPVNKAA